MCVRINYIYVYAQWLSHVQLFVTSWAIFHQAPLSMGFSRQEYWSGLPFPSPGGLPNPRIKPTCPVSLALAMDSLPTWEADIYVCVCIYMYI